MARQSATPARRMSNAGSAAVSPPCARDLRVPSAAAAPDNLRLPDIRLRLRQGRRLALAKACGAAPGLRVHDAFAGWGTDGLVLAALGCGVHMSESNPDVFAVLSRRLQGLRNAQEERLASATLPAPPACFLEDAASRWLAGGAFDVIYLDPIFPTHPKTALASNHMQVLAAIGDRIEDLEGWLRRARRVASSRVVLKRRAKAPRLASPDWSIKGRSVRFDVYRPAVAA